MGLHADLNQPKPTNTEIRRSSRRKSIVKKELVEASTTTRKSRRLADFTKLKELESSTQNETDVDSNYETSEETETLVIKRNKNETTSQGKCERNQTCDKMRQM